MDFLNGNVKKLYGKYLATSMCSALVLSIYSFVDTIAVGQSEGALGAATMAVITPLYEVLVFLAILIGIGGSVLMSNAKGKGKNEKGNAYFTSSLIFMAILTVITWLAFILFYEEIFAFFGADAELIPKVMEYAGWIIQFLPLFIAEPFLSALIRNDGAPVLGMAAVITGGAVNMFLDWYLVFPLSLGMQGAAIATVIGTAVQVAILCAHFCRKKCGLKIVKPYKISSAVRHIFSIGFGAGILNLGMVVLTIMMNNQIMKYSGTTALAVFGVIITVTSLFNALFCGVGQAIQPLVSVNHGAGNVDRVKHFWRMSLGTVLVLGIIFTTIGELIPVNMVRLFVNATSDMIDAAPTIVRLFSVMYIPLGLTVLSTYYLQSIMCYNMSMLIAILRSAAVSGLLIYVLPLFFDITGVWIAVPISETIVAVISLLYIRIKLGARIMLEVMSWTEHSKTDEKK